ncbi:hypothetical protein [Marinicella sp. W31]|uniref:hypothetical protein n=1 Tax=Marinicella sp. W31 TaxID=3023713 RepID=UPI003757843F
MNITDAAIKLAKNNTCYEHKDVHHEHNDCIRIAIEWFDAQVIIENKIRESYPLKHIIEAWGSRYISQSDVEVAANLHPSIFGLYPFYNISRKLICPSNYRLSKIGEAGKHENYKNKDYSELYFKEEVLYTE